MAMAQRAGGQAGGQAGGSDHLYQDRVSDNGSSDYKSSNNDAGNDNVSVPAPSDYDSSDSEMYEYEMSDACHGDEHDQGDMNWRYYMCELDQDAPVACYWQLKAPTTFKIMNRYMDSKHFYRKASKDRDRTDELFLRCQRGSISYERYNHGRLEVFAANRNIALPTQSTTKPELVTLLELADDNATFDRFVDLPSEMRLRIIEFHLATFKGLSKRQFNHGLPQPPVCSVSRLLPTETLPFYYDTFYFPLSVHVAYERVNVPSRSTQFTATKFYPTATADASTVSLYHNIEPQYLARIKHLVIDLYDTPEMDLSAWAVDISDNSQQLLHEMEQPGRYFIPFCYSAKIDGGLRKILEEITQRATNQKLRFDDLEAIEASVDSALRDCYATDWRKRMGWMARRGWRPLNRAATVY